MKSARGSWGRGGGYAQGYGRSKSAGPFARGINISARRLCFNTERQAIRSPSR